MTDEEAEGLVIEAMQGDREAIRRVAALLRGVSASGADQEFAKAVNERAAFLHAAEKLGYMEKEGPYSDLSEDPKIRPVLEKWHNEAVASYPNATSEATLNVVGQAGRKVFGTYEQRVILEKQNQQRAARGETPLEYVIPEEPDESEKDLAEMRAEGIAQRRRLNDGIPLSVIRARRPGVEPAETDET